MRYIYFILIILFITGCTIITPYDDVEYYRIERSCHDYTTRVYIDGYWQTSHGTICRHF